MRSARDHSSSPRPARSRTGSPASASGKIVNDGETVTLNVYLATATGSVHGLVRRPDGTPASNASVVISNGDGAIGFNVTDSAGNYTQDLIPLGPFTIDAFEASTAGHGAATGEIFVAGQNVPVNITEDALAVVTGHLVEAGTSGAAQGLAGLVQPADPFRPIDRADDDERRRRRLLVPRRRGRHLRPDGAETRTSRVRRRRTVKSPRPGRRWMCRSSSRSRGRRSGGSKASCRTPTARRRPTPGRASARASRAR